MPGTSTTPTLLDRVAAAIAHGGTVKAWRGLAAECLAEASGEELAAAFAADLDDERADKKHRRAAIKLHRLAAECADRGARVEASGQTWATGDAA